MSGSVSALLDDAFEDTGAITELFALVGGLAPDGAAEGLAEFDGWAGTCGAGGGCAVCGAA